MKRPIPVLMYHHVNHHKGDIVTVTPEVFEGEMEYLSKKGYRTLKIDELFSYVKGESILHEKGVLITFDDGWLDNYIYAFPVLKKYKINAVIFLITERVEAASNIVRSQESGVRSNEIIIPSHNGCKRLIKDGRGDEVVLNWDIIKEMMGSGLVEFYSHTNSHARCDLLSEDELKEELMKSKEIIEEKLGSPCQYLCWPYGRYNDAALKIAKGIGYKGIFTTERGVVRAGSNPFAVKRIVVKDNVAWFKKRMVIYTNSFLSDIYLKIKKR